MRSAKKLYYGAPISLDLKDADVHNVIRLLADVSGLNIVATDDVKGTITLRLNDIPWDQALDIVLQAQNLESVHEGNVLRISTVKRLREEREELRKAQTRRRRCRAAAGRLHPGQLRQGEEARRAGQRRAAPRSAADSGARRAQRAAGRGGRAHRRAAASWSTSSPTP